MPKKRNKLCCHDQIGTKVQKAIRLRKHLNADALFSIIRGELAQIPDHRTGNVEIPLQDALMAAFAMFSIKSTSLLQFDQKRKDAAEVHNLKTLYGIDVIPSDTSMREICDEVDPKNAITPLFKTVFRQIQRGNALDSLEFYDGHYLLPIDGTGLFSSHKLSCPFSLEKVSSKTGEVTYYHQLLAGALVHPDFKEVIPFCPEMIIKQDGQTKNDCERNAAKRFYEQLRKDHPHLKIIIGGDALYSCAPNIRELQNHKLRYILGVKPGDHEFLFSYVDTAIDEGRTTDFSMEDKDNFDITHCFRILNDVPLNKSNPNLLVNFIEYWEHSEKKDKTIYHNTWICDATLTEKNAYTIMRGGRARWKIENETFNTLKNQGYNFEHNFGLGEKNLCVVFALLMMLAFLVDQIQQLCCPLFKAVWQKCGSKKLLWESIRSFFRCHLLESMESLYRALLYGFKVRPLEELINTS